MLDALDLAADVQWGACVRDARTGQVLAGRSPDRAQRTASLGKLLLLVALAGGGHDLRARIRRDAVAPVADSGLWQHLRDVDALSLHDAAVLVGVVSDNLATNALLEHIGLDRVQSVAGELGLPSLELLDLVRDERRPEHPPTLSRGSAGDLSAFFALAHAGRLHDARVSAQVLAWLAPAADLSMVAAGLGLDPLAHVTPDRGVQVWSKTGTDTGLRADAGLVVGRRRALSYAVLAEFGDERRDDVLRRMREVGQSLRRAVG